MNFTEKYAKYYDLIYKDKDYERECDYLEEIFKMFLRKKPKEILDLACGTGGHAISLTKRGYLVTGIDISKSMLQIAREKAKDNNLKIDFYISSMQNFNLDNKKFDIAICMFSAIDYLVNYRKLNKAIINIKNHLKKGSLFIFDFWNGLTFVNKKFSLRKEKSIIGNNIKINRISKISINYAAQICRINFLVSVYKKNILKDSFKETHYIKYFFPEEMKHYIEDAGFKVIKISLFSKLKGTINSKVRDIAIIAKKE